MKNKPRSITIKNKKLTGDLSIISSKSFAHRILILSALNDREVLIKIKSISDDIRATIACLERLGAKIEKVSQLDDIIIYRVRPIDRPGENLLLDVNESGTSLRLLMPVAASLTKNIRFTARGRLPDRPLLDLINAMKMGGASFSDEKLPFTIETGLSGSYYEIAGNVSSQYISALLLAGPLANKDIEIVLTSKLESRPYVDITINLMKKFGVNVVELPRAYKIKKGQVYKARNSKILVEGDWSNAAFLMLVGCLSAAIKISGLNMASVQGDRRLMAIMEDYGADVSIEKNDGLDILVLKPAGRKPLNVDLTEIPDSLPALAVLAAGARGKSIFYNGKRLKLKESDRLESVSQMIRSLGARVNKLDDGLEIIGSGKLRGGSVDSYGDHRIAMAAAMASMICENPVKIINPMVVEKSYPNFYKDIEKLGAEIYYEYE